MCKKIYFESLSTSGILAKKRDLRAQRLQMLKHLCDRGEVYSTFCTDSYGGIPIDLPCGFMVDGVPVEFLPDMDLYLMNKLLIMVPNTSDEFEKDIKIFLTSVDAMKHFQRKFESISICEKSIIQLREEKK